MMEAERPPGLAALPHDQTKNLLPLADGDRVEQLLLGLDERNDTPPLRFGANGDDDMPVVLGWSRSAIEALAACGNEQLDGLTGDLLADESEEEDEEGAVEVDGEAFASVRRSIGAVRALARTARDAGSNLCWYSAMHY